MKRGETGKGWFPGNHVEAICKRCTYIEEPEDWIGFAMLGQLWCGGRENLLDIGSREREEKN